MNQGKKSGEFIAAYNRWTPEEDRALINQVSRHANNLSEAFRRTAKLLGRSFEACEYRWYAKVGKSAEAGVCFATLGYRTKNVNRKVVSTSTSDNTVKTTLSWWKKIIRYLLFKD